MLHECYNDVILKSHLSKLCIEFNKKKVTSRYYVSLILLFCIYKWKDFIFGRISEYRFFQFLLARKLGEYNSLVSQMRNNEKNIFCHKVQNFLFVKKSC